MYYVYRTTTDKLSDALTSIGEAGDVIVQPTWMGGRDWLIICRKASAEVDYAAPGVPRQFDSEVPC
jgi:hypothetical protein